MWMFVSVNVCVSEQWLGDRRCIKQRADHCFHDRLRAAVIRVLGECIILQ